MRSAFRPLPLVAATALALAVLGAIGADHDEFNTDKAAAVSTASGHDDDRWDVDSRYERIEWLRRHKGLEQIETIVVIYAENRGFDNLYGLFPGANGLNKKILKKVAPQRDRDGSELPVLPPTWGGLTAAGQTTTITQAQTANLPNAPFQIDDPISAVGFSAPKTVTTRDAVHRFYNNQMQINGGKNDLFAAYSDAGGLTMGYYDGSDMAMWKIAKKYVLADNFFMGAFGGSFLTHQYLICACAPVYPNAGAADSPAKNSISAIDVDSEGNFIRLTPASTMPASALDGPPKYLNDSTLTPADKDGIFHAVNTMQPPYQPSGNAPAATDSTLLFADPAKASTLPPQSQTNIGDLLSAKRIDWTWYAGGWNASLSDRTKVYTAAFGNFQAHHHPFNYFAEFDPVAHGGDRTAHLKDYDDLVAAAAAGTLPPVAFYKPIGIDNQHPGYTDVADGDAHIADVIARLQQSPQWKRMVIIVTYDENGGFWDHVAPPKGDRWGPGTRIPAIIVSPFAKRGYIDHTQYDTASILRLITRRFHLAPLPGLVERDLNLLAHGDRPMGDLTNALDLGRR